MTNTKQKSDLSRAFAEDGELKTHVGGQALLEGIMMRGKYNWSVAVREPQGTIYTEEHDLASGKDKNGWLYWPFVRGCRAFVESLALGYKALTIAAEHAFIEDEEEAPEGSEATPSPLPNGADENEGDFSWKRDFGNPDEMIDALGAQRTLEVVSEPAGEAAAPEEAGAAESAHEGAEEQAAGTKPLLSEKEMLISMGLGLVMGIVLFVVAPAFITNLIVGEYDERTLLWNVVDGILRIGVFIFYIWLIGRMEDIKRMFGYHGAEHKTIHCFEHGLPLTPENARSFPRLHVRCGTAFLIMVMIIAIFVYTITPLDALIEAWGVPAGAPKLALVIIVRILLMPVIAGIAYEITVKWAGSHPSNPLVKVILWPGMQMQYLTTREPDDGQIECAIEAMKLVLEREQLEEAAATQ
ncbi:MAG: DUF1385 domain-containing protein [Coriobacteriaceae bacterium]|nr:DUF1385 domain-containing protein [Coriobacteriaceae bacterium]